MKWQLAPVLVLLMLCANVNDSTLYAEIVNDEISAHLSSLETAFLAGKVAAGIRDGVGALLNSAKEEVSNGDLDLAYLLLEQSITMASDAKSSGQIDAAFESEFVTQLRGLQGEL